MNYPSRARLILEISWWLVSLALLAFGWISYSQGKASWWSVLALIFGAMFLLYSIGSTIFYWRLYRKRSKKV